ncbi:MAG: carboxypeptidase regulatory-like domain-containing protein [Anaerolineales bacterium]|uniref:glycoside hydrolase family 113 n=1 Tax=Candidatus Villigracilis vicinus TaxID=3140679 RepID=UPI00313501A4|nr:carboxypeptidase regulatory-like domain-containing protein [Anaerolineales bacterium]
MNVSSIPLRRWLSAAALVVLVGQACTISLFNPPSDGTGTATPGPVAITNTPYAATQTTFIVTLPEPLLPGETLAISILDEVTGLSLNATQYPMTPRDNLTYTATLPLPVSSVVKYRYIRLGGAGAVEDTTFGTAIRYRLHSVASSAEVHDVIADWSDRSYARATGTIHGQVYNSDTGSPIPNILVTAGGIHYITDSLGRFEIAGLPTGTHQLTAYSLDGLYQPFQQGAVVAEGNPTIVDLRIKPTSLVNVTFMVSVPQDTVPGVPVRIAGNILQFGNTFADLQGGESVVSDRMPILNLQPDGRYSITLGLPVGTYIQYKYTLGGGYWNAEHKNDGGWIVREFLVPNQDIVVQDTVATWLASDQSGPILFEASVPSVTLAEDIVYIQFKGAGWMEPIPMWPLGNNRWAYQLYSPLNFLGSFSYRYCRNGQCGSADDNQTVGNAPTGRIASTSLLGQDIQDSVGSWKWFENPETFPLVGTTITPRTAGFVAGVEYQPVHHPNFSYYAPQAFANTKAIGSNLVVLTPTWSVTNVAPLRFSTTPGQDPFWIDSAIMISQARALGLNTAIFPTPQFLPSADTSISASTQFWKNAPKDAAWWQTWFTRYRAFLVNYADLATQTGAQTIILGGDWVTPALPGGLLPDGSASNVPADAEAQWRAIIQDVRSHFKGQVLWAMPYEKSSFTTPVSFLRDMDGIYLLWSTPIAPSPTSTKTDYTNEAGRLLDNEVAPLASLLGKPVILAVSYPAVAGAPNGCVANGSGGCLDFNALSRPNTDLPSVSLNLQTQADIYEAMLTAINARPWVAGFVSRGYYLPVTLQDKSTSIHGKPAANVVWYWYPRLLGTVR